MNTCKDKRPLIKDKNEEELYAFIVESLEKREPYYSKAKIILETEELINRDDVNKYIQQLTEKL